MLLLRMVLVCCGGHGCGVDGGRDGGVMMLLLLVVVRWCVGVGSVATAGDKCARGGRSGSEEGGDDDGDDGASDT